MPNPIDQTPAARVALLFEFSWGDPIQYARYACWSSNVTLQGNVFTAQPALAVDIPKEDGGVSDDAAKIRLPVISPVSNMKTTHPTVTVTVWEMDPANEATAFVLHKGIITQADFNHNGNANVVQIAVAGRKIALNTTLSFKIGRWCPWIFGFRPCGFDREARKEPVTIVSISGQQVTVSGFVSINDPDLWKFGGIRRDGLEISIHQHVAGTQIFYTTKPLPPSWVGQTADVLPGCGKTIADCRVRGQEENFGAMGVKIPDRDVRYQD